MRGAERARAAALFSAALVLSVALVGACSPLAPGSSGGGEPAASVRPDPTGPAPEGMVLVKGGTYLMGSEDGEADERPVRRVALDPFYVDAREVTNAEFERFVAETDYEAEGLWRRYAGAGRESHPAVAVTWNDASKYAEWAGKRLPTEAEWEAAARGGVEGRRYPNGDAVAASDATFGQRYEDAAKTTPAGAHAPNALGVYDMAGNVWEWCADYYAADAYARSAQANPRGPERGATRVLRGGSWADPPEHLRAANRLELTPSIIGPIFGFRCAKTP